MLEWAMPRESEPIKLSQKERSELIALTRKTKLSDGYVRRVRIVLLADEGLDNQLIAARLDLHRNSIGKWRRVIVPPASPAWRTSHVRGNR